MNVDLGFSAAVYGFGAGIFFIGYALFEIPSNLVTESPTASSEQMVPELCLFAYWPKRFTAMLSQRLRGLE